jgi:hypothetical protein
MILFILCTIKVLVFNESITKNKVNIFKMNKNIKDTDDLPLLF